jgi:hypothetical protein
MFIDPPGGDGLEGCRRGGFETRPDPVFASQDHDPIRAGGCREPLRVIETLGVWSGRPGGSTAAYPPKLPFLITKGAGVMPAPSCRDLLNPTTHARIVPSGELKSSFFTS